MSSVKRHAGRPCNSQTKHSYFSLFELHWNCACLSRLQAVKTGTEYCIHRRSTRTRFLAKALTTSMPSKKHSLQPSANT
eukprot:scaffold155045_cov19-Prasinocladus_malaysianus.AAC.1